MGTMKSFAKANPNYGYSFKSLLMRAVASDYDFLEDLAQNSTSLVALKNLFRVAFIMDRGYDDEASDWGNKTRYLAAERIKELKAK